MSDVKRVKIEYGGGPGYNTKVTDADTGETIPGVFRVDLTLEATQIPIAKLYTYMPATNVTVEATTHAVCPYCGQEVAQEEVPCA